MRESAGREVLIVDAVRTPVGKGHPEKGYYKGHHANDLLAACYTALLERTGVDPAVVDDVVTGCVFQYGEQTYNIGRNAWLQAGLPVEVPATTVDRQCGSAQQAVNFAAALIGSGAIELAIGCGVEHMGHVPMEVAGETVVADQGIRPDTNLETLAGLRPAFREEGKITAGNASQISDGAAAAMLASRDKTEELGLRPRARIIDQVAVGVDPVIMLTGPIPATEKLLERNGMTIGDIDLIEINEAFASVVAAWERELAPDPERVNVNGGAMAIGHPLGSTGARLVATLLHELERSDGSVGLVTMCCGGGIGTGTLIERI